MIAASGGPDSCALAIIGAISGRATLGHVNHHLQPACHSFEEAVVGLGQRLDLEVRVAHVDGDAILRGSRGLEADARIARYRALAALCDGPILTAHTAHDRLDTVLMRLLQGTGLSALDGPRAELELEGRRIVRPMLDWFEEDVAALLNAWGITPAEDPSNRDRQRLRNAIRPVARQLAALAEPEPLARSLDNLAHDAARLRDADDARIGIMTRSFGTDTLVHVGALVRLDHRDAVQTLTHVLGQLGVRASSDFAARILTLERGDRTRAAGIVAEHCGEVIRLAPSRLEKLSAPRVQLEVADETQCPMGVLRRTEAITPPTHLHAIFDPSALVGRLVLRSIEESDSFVPHGRSKEVAIMKRLARDGQPETVRRTRLALADDIGVLWIVGGRRGSRALVSNGGEAISFQWTSWEPDRSDR